MPTEISGLGITTPGLASGTMPTSGGDPVVESGSNSDGSWTRWADGTQEVRYLHTVHPDTGSSAQVARQGSYYWTYPVAFAANPVFIPQMDCWWNQDGHLSGGTDNTGSFNVSGNSRAPSSGNIGAKVHWHYHTYTGCLWAHLYATGRWK